MNSTAFLVVINDMFCHRREISQANVLSFFYKNQCFNIERTNVKFRKFRT